MRVIFLWQAHQIYMVIFLQLQLLQNLFLILLIKLSCPTHKVADCSRGLEGNSRALRILSVPSSPGNDHTNPERATPSPGSSDALQHICLSSKNCSFWWNNLRVVKVGEKVDFSWMRFEVPNFLSYLNYIFLPKFRVALSRIKIEINSNWIIRVIFLNREF